MPDAVTLPIAEQGRLIALYDAQALLLAEAGGAFAGLFAGRGPRDEHIDAILHHVGEACALRRDVWHEAGQVFADPSDRIAIAELFAALERVTGDMTQTALSIRRYDITDLDPGMQNLAHVVVDAIDTTGMAIPLLRSASRYRERLVALATTLYELGARADDLHDAGLRTLFETATDAMAFVVRREVYAHLKRLGGDLEDVAARLERLAG